MLVGNIIIGGAASLITRKLYGLRAVLTMAFPDSVRFVYYVEVPLSGRHPPSQKEQAKNSKNRRTPLTKYVRSFIINNSYCY